MQRISLLGLPLDLISLEETLLLLSGWLQDPSARKTVVTNNPEFIVQAQTDSAFAADIAAADLVTADGIGMVLAGKKFGHAVPRATGVDIAKGLMAQNPGLRVYFLGAKPGVAARAAAACAEQYNIVVAGVQDGYFSPDQSAQIAKSILESDTHLLLTGLGGGKQERFNQTHRVARVAIGCGGTIDVLAGEAPLAPQWIRNIGFEWLWRIVKFKRWQRGLRLLEFAFLALRWRSKT